VFGPGNGVDLSGVRVRKGEKIMAMLAAANMDPAAKEHPERLDLERRSNRHLAFGTGSTFVLAISWRASKQNVRCRFCSRAGRNL
jgi:hypothetical protein